MVDLLAANWMIALAISLFALITLWVLSRKRAAKRRERHRAPDALDAGVAPAQRNRALIDAPSAVTIAKNKKKVTE